MNDKIFFSDTDISESNKIITVLQRLIFDFLFEQVNQTSLIVPLFEVRFHAVLLLATILYQILDSNLIYLQKALERVNLAQGSFFGKSFNVR